MNSRRSDFLKRFLLALYPILVTYIVLGVEVLARQHILFTSLISSTFLIYTRHKDPMNDGTTLVISQCIAAIIGYVSYWVGGENYPAACVTIFVVALVLIALHRLHPPAIVTSLIFQFRTHSVSDLELFGLLILLIIILFFTKLFYSRLVHRLGFGWFD